MYNAPEGFSVALPQGWKRLSEDISPGNVAYRIVFGADDDPRTLTVTYSQRLRPDPVAVWREDVEPGLIQADIGFKRIGEIRATTYRGRSGADMEWLSDVGGHPDTNTRPGLPHRREHGLLAALDDARGRLERHRQPAGAERLPADLQRVNRVQPWAGTRVHHRLCGLGDRPGSGSGPVCQSIVNARI